MPKIPYLGRQVEAEEVDFQTRREEWNEYQLMDGSTLKMKSVVTGIVKVSGEFDVMGNPAYVINSQNVTAVNSPDELKKKI